MHLINPSYTPQSSPIPLRASRLLRPLVLTVGCQGPVGSAQWPLTSSGRGRRIHHTLNYLTPISSAGERGLTRCNLVTEPAPLVVPYLWATRNLGAVC